MDNQNSELEFLLWSSKILICVNVNWCGLRDGDGKKNAICDISVSPYNALIQVVLAHFLINEVLDQGIFFED